MITYLSEDASEKMRQGFEKTVEQSFRWDKNTAELYWTEHSEDIIDIFTDILSETVSVDESEEKNYQIFSDSINGMTEEKIKEIFKNSLDELPETEDY